MNTWIPGTEWDTSCLLLLLDQNMPAQLSNFKGMKGIVFSNMKKEVLWTECLCVCPPPPHQNSDVEALSPNLMVFGDGAFRI